MITLSEFNLNMSRRGFLKSMGLGGLRKAKEELVENVVKENPIQKLMRLKGKVEKVSDDVATLKPMTRRKFLKGAARQTLREVTENPQNALRKAKMAGKIAKTAGMSGVNTMADFI